jgi:hypothetical protein
MVKLPPVVALPVNIIALVSLKVHVMTSGVSTPMTTQTSSKSVLTTTGRGGWTVITIGGTAQD